MESLEIFLYNDQPTTCPKCGNRTEIVFEYLDMTPKKQLHKCLSKYCIFDFIVEFDTDF